MADDVSQGLTPVVQMDPRLAAGRGEEFSAAAQRAKAQRDWESMLDDEDSFRIPIGARIEDSLDTGGLQTASLHEAIPQSNKGFQMLQRMGWKGQGHGLGRKQDGIAEPIRGGVEAGLRIGLGKAEQDDFYTAAENITRKQLEVEIQAQEDEQRTKRREEQVARDIRIASDVKDIKRNLYCETCHKQYNSASEMETHLSSYDHHHKKRLIEMRADELERTRRDRDRRERKRLSKDAAKLNDQIQRAHKARGGELSLPEAPPLPPPEDPHTIPTSTSFAPPPPLPLEPSSIPSSSPGFVHPSATPHGSLGSRGSGAVQRSGVLGAAGVAHSGSTGPPPPPPPPPEPPQGSFAAPPASRAGKPFAAKRGKLKPVAAAFQMDDDDE